MLRDKIYRDIAQTIDSHSRFESTEFSIVTSKVNSNSVGLSINYLN